MADETVPTRNVGEVAAERIREVRQRRGLSQRDLADIIERSYEHPLDATMVNKIERGTRGVSLDDLLVIAAALNVSPPALLASTNALHPVSMGTRFLVSPAFFTWCAGEGPASFTEDDAPPDADAFWRESVPQPSYEARKAVPTLRALRASLPFLEQWIAMLLTQSTAAAAPIAPVADITADYLDSIESIVRDLREQVEGLI
jgi:transcriptional regulator with XRE-family HTH domain